MFELSVAFSAALMSFIDVWLCGPSASCSKEVNAAGQMPKSSVLTDSGSRRSGSFLSVRTGIRNCPPLCIRSRIASSTAVKCFEAAEAIGDGADELDMVANIGWIKAGMFREVRDEIMEVKRICARHILKVIIETCLLTEEEKVEMCRVVSESGADFIKTSTGFSAGGATFEDVKLMKASIQPHLRIKAAGGIATLADAETFLALGADRLGTSRIVKLAKELKE